MNRTRLSAAITGLVVTSLLAATVPVAAQQPATLDEGLPEGGTYLDDDWNFAEGAIEAVTKAGVVEGCAPQLFCPERPLTRAEAAALIARIIQPSRGQPGQFPDVDDGAWYAEDVAALADAGVLTGHSDGTFSPSSDLTRAEMAELLVRAFPERFPPATAHFDDIPPDATYAPAVGRLWGSGVTAGCATGPPRYCPQDTVDRDQMAMFLARVLGLEMKVPPRRRAPLNGLPVRGLDWNRRVVAVKIDDHRGARPQSGISSADAVIETLVEGGLTRWIALFHQSDTSHLGPVRSLRPTDTGLVLPLGATVAASGGQQWITDAATSEGVQLLRERDARPALFRITERSAPHNLYADTTALRAIADSSGYTDAPPPPIFDWGSMPDGIAATSISLEWSDPITVTWTFDGTRYLRWRDGAPHFAVDPDGALTQISADSLVVLLAAASELPPPPEASGSPVPVLDTLGRGSAFVFAEGRAVRGVWTRNSHVDQFSLTTPDGHPLLVPPGVPWINIFPEGRVIRS